LPVEREMETRSWRRVLVSGAIVVVTAGTVVFVGRNAAEGDPAPAPTPVGQYPSGPFTMSAEDWAAEDEAWREEERSNPLPTPFKATSVTIGGQEIDLPDGITASSYGISHVPGTFYDLSYVDPLTGATSDMSIEVREPRISRLRVRPEHEQIFDPFVQAAGGWPSPSPVPTPIVARLGEHAFLLPDGMEYYPPNAQHPYGAAVFAYAEPLHVSRVYVDPDGKIVKQEIFPDHLDKFAGLLEEFASVD
jgi:hypothetical protein